jgi:hypothetical protein
MPTGVGGREISRSRLNGEERAMPSSSNRLLASLSTDDFNLLGPHLKTVILGLRKNLERPTGESTPFISRKRDSHPLLPFNPTESRSR